MLIALDCMQVLRRILTMEIVLPPSLDASAAALVRRLLVREPTQRLGTGPSGTAEVQADGFWAPLTFEGVDARQYPPAWLPPEPVPPKPKAPKASPPQPSITEEVGDSDEMAASDDLDGSDEDEDDEDDDEWHQHGPPARDGARDGSGAVDQKLFRGFTFRRERTFIMAPKPR